MDGSHSVWRAQLSAPFPEPCLSGIQFVALQKKAEFLVLALFAILKSEAARGRVFPRQSWQSRAHLRNHGQVWGGCCRTGSRLCCGFQHICSCAGLSLSSGLKIMLFCLLHKPKKCSLLFHVASWERTGLRLR